MGHVTGCSPAAADKAGVEVDGTKAGLNNNYVRPNDPRVIAHTRVIGGGETTSVSSKPSALKPSADYVFFCSFPGDAAVMHGAITLAK